MTLDRPTCWRIDNARLKKVTVRVDVMQYMKLVILSFQRYYVSCASKFRHVLLKITYSMFEII